MLERGIRWGVILVELRVGIGSRSVVCGGGGGAMAIVVFVVVHGGFPVVEERM